MSPEDKTYAGASTEALAEAVAGYMEALVKNGVTRLEALTLTVAWVVSLNLAAALKQEKS